MILECLVGEILRANVTLIPAFAIVHDFGMAKAVGMSLKFLITISATERFWTNFIYASKQ